MFPILCSDPFASLSCVPTRWSMSAFDKIRRAASDRDLGVTRSDGASSAPRSCWISPLDQMASSRTELTPRGLLVDRARRALQDHRPADRPSHHERLTENARALHTRQRLQQSESSTLAQHKREFAARANKPRVRHAAAGCWPPPHSDSWYRPPPQIPNGALGDCMDPDYQPPHPRHSCGGTVEKF